MNLVRVTQLLSSGGGVEAPVRLTPQCEHALPVSSSDLRQLHLTDGKVGDGGHNHQLSKKENEAELFFAHTCEERYFWPVYFLPEC